MFRRLSALLALVVVSAVAVILPSPSEAAPAVGNGEIAYSQGTQVFMVSPSGGSETSVVGGCFGCYVTGGYAWSPNGRKLAFVGGQSYGGLRKPPKIGLYVASASGTHLRRLLACGSCGVDYQSPISWSPDGSRIVMGDGRRVAIVNVKTRSHRLVGPGCKGRWNVPDPAWSPNGAKIAFACGASLYVVTRNGTDAHLIATVPGQPEVGHLSWSPDGNTLLFDTWNSIYSVGADGSHLTDLLAGQFGTLGFNPQGMIQGPYFPSWSPDGKRILYLHAPCTDIWCTRSYELWAMNADGTQKDLLYRSVDPIVYFAPAVWSPDGQQILFSTYTGTYSGLMTINADGTGLHTVADVAETTDLAWQPLP
jgi:Tol biopolymer transport system component